MHPATPRSSRIWLPIVLLSLAATWPAMATSYDGLAAAIVICPLVVIVFVAMVVCVATGKFRTRGGFILGIVMGLFIAVLLTVYAIIDGVTWIDSWRLLFFWLPLIMPISQRREAKPKAATEQNYDSPEPDTDEPSDATK